MDYKGKKVWFFRVIPLVYSSNQVEWSVDVKNQTLNNLADRVVTKVLEVCAFLRIPVILSPRHDKRLVKKQPAADGLRRGQLTEV